MRIIAGELKGRRLKTPEDNRVRPTADKVKEAVFSMISPWIYDSTAVDLFAGTGNLGLEAISRGASHVIFVDKDRRSIALIRENAAYCRVEDRVRHHLVRLPQCCRQNQREGGYRVSGSPLRQRAFDRRAADGCGKQGFSVKAALLWRSMPSTKKCRNPSAD